MKYTLPSSLLLSVLLTWTRGRLSQAIGDVWQVLCEGEGIRRVGECQRTGTGYKNLLLQES